MPGRSWRGAGAVGEGGQQGGLGLRPWKPWRRARRRSGRDSGCGTACQSDLDLVATRPSTLGRFATEVFGHLEQKLGVIVGRLHRTSAHVAEKVPFTAGGTKIPAAGARPELRLPATTLRGLAGRNRAGAGGLPAATLRSSSSGTSSSSISSRRKGGSGYGFSAGGGQRRAGAAGVARQPHAAERWLLLEWVLLLGSRLRRAYCSPVGGGRGQRRGVRR